MVVAATAAAALFFVLWWVLQDEENPWIPAGLAASVVMLVAASARQVVMRHASTRYVVDHERERHSEKYRSGRRSSIQEQNEALRTIEKQSAAADANDSLPEAHLELFQLCGEFLERTNQALASPTLSTERRLAWRTRQERAQALQKHHLLSWARDSARMHTHDAQQRVRLHEKIEVANRALDCIDTALRKYPDEEELNRSVTAVREFISSARVAHWVEMAQRASFKGYYRRAIDRYRDALFYLTRDDPEGERAAAAQQITREIELLRARLATHKAVGLDHESDERFS